MNISMDQIKELREKTGISVMQCRKALEDAGGDMAKAIVLLQKKGAEAAAKKAERELKSGRVGSYIHGGGSVGVLVELWSESDFVLKERGFRETCPRDRDAGRCDQSRIREPRTGAGRGDPEGKRGSAR